MPGCLVFLGRRIALAFLRDDVQHFGTVVVLYLAQYAHETNHVVPVCRTKVADVQTLEDITRLLGKRGFQVVTQVPLIVSLG